MSSIVVPEHDQTARRFRQIYSTYRQNRDLLSVGAYKAGSDARIDEAVALHARFSTFLQQHASERVPWNESLAGLAAALLGEDA